MGRSYAKNIPLTGGIQKATSDLAGDGFLTLQNVSRYKADSVRRRPGLATRIETAGIVMSGLRINNEDRLIQLLDTGAIVSHATSYEAVVSTVVAASVVTSSTYGVFAHANNYLIFANGTDAVRYINSVASTGTVGLDAPTGDMPAVYSTTTTAGTTPGMTAGTHLVRYRYVETDEGYWSDPSGVVSIETVEGTWRFQIGTTSTTITLPTDGRVDRVYIESTKAAGTVFYPIKSFGAAVSSGSTVIVRLSDQEMEGKSYTFDYPESAREDVGNAPPPVLDYVAEHRGRLFGLFSRYLYWSQFGRPHSWNSADQSRSVFQSSDDQATGLTSVDSDLYLFGRFSCWRFAYNEFPDEGVLTKLPTRVGLWHQRLLCRAEGQMYGWGPSGIWVLNVMLPKIISEEVRPLLIDEIDFDYVEQFHCTHDPEDRTVLFFYVPEGSTTVTGCLVYDYVNQEWRTHSYDRAIDASYTLTKQGGQSRAFLADGNGYTWHLESKLLDGVLSGQNSKFTADSTATGTTIAVNETVQVSETLEGSYLYRESDGTSRLITGNNATSFTIDSAFSTVSITAGEEFWAGSIEMIVEPKWFVSPDPFDKVRVKQVAFNQIPDSTSTGDWLVYQYLDFSATPSAKTAEASDEPPRGQTVVDGDSYSGAEMTKQYVGLRYFASDWARAVKLKFTQRDPDCDPTLVNIAYRFETADGGAE